MKVFVAVVLCGLILLFGLAAIDGASERAPPESLPDRIERECRASYGTRGEEAVSRCRLALSVKILEDRERDKLKSIYDRVR
jgi:hypothetical protein